jgi:hypothetical protein
MTNENDLIRRGDVMALPPYDSDGDPSGIFDHKVFVKLDAIAALPAVAASQTVLERASTAQIAALVDALDACIANIEHADMSDGVCCCGDNMDGHSDPMSCGHAPVDMGKHYAHLAIVKARAAIAAVKGGDA